TMSPAPSSWTSSQSMSGGSRPSVVPPLRSNAGRLTNDRLLKLQRSSPGPRDTHNAPPSEAIVSASLPSADGHGGASGGESGSGPTGPVLHGQLVPGVEVRPSDAVEGVGLLDQDEGPGVGSGEGDLDAHREVLELRVLLTTETQSPFVPDDGVEVRLGGTTG